MTKLNVGSVLEGVSQLCVHNACYVWIVYYVSVDPASRVECFSRRICVLLVVSIVVVTSIYKLGSVRMVSRLDRACSNVYMISLNPRRKDCGIHVPKSL